MKLEGLIKGGLETLSLKVGSANGKLPLPKESFLPNMWMESLPLEISTTAVLSDCFCILQDTHTLALLTLSTVLQCICPAQCPKLVLEQALKQTGQYLKARDWSWNPLRNSWRLTVFQMPILLGFTGMKWSYLCQKQNWLCDYGCQFSFHVVVQIAIWDRSIYNGRWNSCPSS